MSGLIDTIRGLLLPERLEIRHNSEWLSTLTMEDILSLTSKFTVSRIMGPRRLFESLGGRKAHLVG